MTILDMSKLTVTDADESPKEPPKQKRKAASNGTSGRRRFAEEICPLHGQGEYGDPCEKFAHLPGGGRGLYQPGTLKGIIVVLRVLIKPIAICSVLGIGGFLLLFWFTNILQSHSFVPATTGGMPNRVGSTPGNSVHYCRIVGNSLPLGCQPGDKVIWVKSK